MKSTNEEPYWESMNTTNIPNTSPSEKSLVEQLQETLDQWDRFLLAQRTVPVSPRVTYGASNALLKIFGRESNVVKHFAIISKQAVKEADPKIGLRYLHTFLSIVVKSLNERVPSDIYQACQPSRVFVGHGRNPIWMKVLLHLQNDLHLQAEAYETEPRTSEHVIDVLKDILDRCNVAVIIMTADDPTAFDTVRARQNAVHEAGLFQGRYGFGRVILFQQEGTEEFANIAGLERILFSKDIEEGFYKFDRAIEKLGL